MSDEELEAKLAEQVSALARGDQALAAVRDQAAEVAVYYMTLRDAQVPAALAGQLTRAWQASAWAEDTGF